MWPGKVIAAEHVNATRTGEPASQSHCWRAPSHLHVGMGCAAPPARLGARKSASDGDAGVARGLRWRATAASLAAAGALDQLRRGYVLVLVACDGHRLRALQPDLPLTAAHLPGQRLSTLPALRPGVACRAHRHSALCARRHCGRLFRRARAGWTLVWRGDSGAAGAQSALPGDDTYPAAPSRLRSPWGWSGWPAH